MKKIGMIVAVEMQAVHKRYGEPKEIRVIHNQKVYVYDRHEFELYVMQCGAGEIVAAGATQLLISDCNVEAILNFGVVGGLTEEISAHRFCVVKSVVHYEFDTSEADDTLVGQYAEYDTIYIPADAVLLEAAKKQEPRLWEVVCASGNKFIASPEEKKCLHDSFDADICEMEAAGILLTCNRNQIPCLLIKMVADGINGGAKEFFDEFEAASDLCLDVLDQNVKEMK